MFSLTPLPPFLGRLGSLFGGSNAPLFLAVVAGIGLSGCATTEPVARGPVPCETQAIYEEGVSGRVYPQNCADDEALFKTYKISQRIRQLEAEHSEVDYLIARGDDHLFPASFAPRGFKKRFGYHRYHRRRHFASTAYLVGRREDIAYEIRALRREAGLI